MPHAPAEENLASASPELLRARVKTLADARMCAEADALSGAEYGQVGEERVNHRNGYRSRDGTGGQGRSSRPSPRCGRAVASRAGSSNAAAVPSRPSSAWPPPPVC
ncbi:transposase [Streptomyces sp. NPDC050564]|uniref:transposase n=1 Tax=Streptomyces sp. NPDC050564 TaxID=3365631 RepID=UPI003797559E